MKLSVLFQACVLYILLLSSLFSQTGVYDSGGSLMHEQAAYDVTFYNLDLFVNPADSSIQGSVLIDAKIVQPIDRFVVDLDTLLSIQGITEINADGGQQLHKFIRDAGKIWITLNTTRQPGENISIKIEYGGYPLIALRPPWTGGFQWDETEDGSPWIATSCQGEGADIWWPVKDHVSDEPDSMRISIRIPSPLFCASNGRLESQVDNNDGTITYNWFVSNPINTYNVALNIAPYKLIDTVYTSVAGDKFPVMFWVLPEDYDKGRKFFAEILEHIRFFEDHLGPYPFRADKYGVVQTPHLGMEHQTIVAYGANFNNGAMTGGRDWGFDALHHHEFSHEWWGNLVTCSDWKDMWLHEGFGTYMQALYVEERDGIEKYHEFMKVNMHFGNNYPVAPLESKTGKEIGRSPVYTKGAWFLHILRHVIGDDAFNVALRRMAYPDPEMESVTDGMQTRFASSDDFLSIAEQVSGMQLDWLFNIYLHQPKLPKLDINLEENALNLKWNTPDNLPFPIPLDILSGNTISKVVVPSEGLEIPIDGNDTPFIDPDNWVLFEPSALDSAKFYIKAGRYEDAYKAYDLAMIADQKNKAVQNMIRHLEFVQSNQSAGSTDYKRFEGKYRLFRNYSLSVTLYEDGLYLIGGMSGKTKLYPISSSKFVSPDSETIFEFVMDEDDNVKELAMGRRSAEKIRE